MKAGFSKMHSIWSSQVSTLRLQACCLLIKSLASKDGKSTKAIVDPKKCHSTPTATLFYVNI